MTDFPLPPGFEPPDPSKFLGHCYEAEKKERCCDSCIEDWQIYGNQYPLYELEFDDGAWCLACCRCLEWWGEETEKALKARLAEHVTPEQLRCTVPEGRALSEPLREKIREGMRAPGPVKFIVTKE